MRILIRILVVGCSDYLFIGFCMPNSKIVSEYDQEIPQSQTADNPMAP